MSTPEAPVCQKHDIEAYQIALPDPRLTKEGGMRYPWWCPVGHEVPTPKA